MGVKGELATVPVSPVLEVDMGVKAVCLVSI
jgi:hypothetical protein